MSAQREEAKRLQVRTDSGNGVVQAKIPTRPQSDDSLRKANAPESGTQCPHRQPKRASFKYHKNTKPKTMAPNEVDTDHKGGDEDLAGDETASTFAK